MRGASGQSGAAARAGRRAWGFYAKAHRGARCCALRAYTSGGQKSMTLEGIRKFIREAGLAAGPGGAG